MSIWTTPATAATGAVTSSFWNTEVRDHLNFLKGAFDLLTNSSTSDTGTGTYIQVRRTSSTDVVFEGQVGAEANPRIRIFASGKISLGAGGANAPDASLERVSASVLRLTDDTSLRIDRTAVGTQFFNCRLTSDTNDRFRVDADASGNARIRFGDGTTVGYTDLYHDLGSGQFILGGTAGSFRFVHGSLIVNFGTSTASRFLTVDAGAGSGRITFGNSADVGIERTATGRLHIVGRLAADAGFANYVKSGTISDTDFAAPSAESGLQGVDTADERLYVRVGTTWRYADLRGAMTAIGPFYWDNLAASQTDLDGSYGNTTSIQRAFSPYPGDIVALTVRGSATISAGGGSAAVFKAVIAGSNGTLTCTLDSTTNTQQNSATQAPGTDTFTAGQTLGVRVTTSGTFAPTTTEYAANLFVLMRRP